MKEKLQEYALIAEIVGGLAIVASLIFVGLEVKQNNAIARTESYQSNVNSLNEWRTLLITTGLSKDWRDYVFGGTLNPDSQEDISRLSQIVLSIYDQAFDSYRNGVLDEAGWERFGTICPVIQSYRKLQEQIGGTDLAKLLTESYLVYVEHDCVP
jgi:hypothetical protein